MSSTCSLCGRSKNNCGSVDVVVGADIPQQSIGVKKFYGEFQQLTPIWFCPLCWRNRQKAANQDLLPQALIATAAGAIGTILWLVLREDICMIGFPFLLGGIIFAVIALVRLKNPRDYSTSLPPQGKKLMEVFSDVIPYIVYNTISNIPGMSRKNYYWELSNWQEWQKQPGNVVGNPYEMQKPRESANEKEINEYRKKVEQWIARGNLKRALNEIIPDRKSSSVRTIHASVLEKMGRYEEAFISYREAITFNTDNAEAQEGARRVQAHLPE